MSSQQDRAGELRQEIQVMQERITVLITQAKAANTAGRYHDASDNLAEASSILRSISVKSASAKKLEGA